MNENLIPANKRSKEEAIENGIMRRGYRQRDLYPACVYWADADEVNACHGIDAGIVKDCIRGHYSSCFVNCR